MELGNTTARSGANSLMLDATSRNPPIPLSLHGITDVNHGMSEIIFDIRFVKGAAYSDLGIFHHLAGHHDLTFDQQRPFCLYTGLRVNIFLKVNLRPLGKLILQGKI